MNRQTYYLIAFALTIAAVMPASADTLDTVKNRGVVICGVNPGLKGFSQSNSLGVYSGFDVDLCRAVASAIFGDPEAAEFVPISASERFDALTTNKFDVLTRNTTWTLERNASYGEYAGVSYYDGQGFMVRKRSGIRSAMELDNKPICVSRGTTTELNAVDFFKVSDMRYKPVYFEDGAKAIAGYESEKCIAFTTDRSGLAAQRADLEQPDAHLVLPEVISKEPLGPMVRIGDARWANVVRWTLNCMINAEEMGLTSKNINRKRSASSPAARRLTGAEGDAGARLGLSAEWCANVIREVGNYAENYERNVGPDTDLALERGVNQLWTDGGLMYAPPIR
ncbi:MAG: amino acid ABC transporter substrate-binding protein [Granulosicoccus sp.]